MKKMLLITTAALLTPTTSVLGFANINNSVATSKAITQHDNSEWTSIGIDGVKVKWSWKSLIIGKWSLQISTDSPIVAALRDKTKSWVSTLSMLAYKLSGLTAIYADALASKLAEIFINEYSSFLYAEEAILEITFIGVVPIKKQVKTIWT